MTTRAQLRRSIGLRTGQNFFRRFGGGVGTASDNGTTTTLKCTTLLKEADNYWRGDFIYLPATDETREVSAFTQSTSLITWLAPIASATQAGDTFELWSQFTPGEVHNAINSAIRNAWPFYFASGEDESTVVVSEGGIKYTLPTSDTIRRVLGVYLMGYESVTGEVTTAGTNVQIIDSGASFDADDVGQWIAVYQDGDDAQGEVRQISVVDSATQVTVSSAFSGIVPVGAKYRKIDKNTEFPSQWPINDYLLDAEDAPTTIWLGRHPEGYEGYLLKFVYEYEFAELSSDSDTTACPEEYVQLATLAYLYFNKMASAPAVELPTWKDMFEASRKATESYIRVTRYRHQAGQIRKHNLTHAGYIADNPFSWR